MGLHGGCGSDWGAVCRCGWSGSDVGTSAHEVAEMIPPAVLTAFTALANVASNATAIPPPPPSSVLQLQSRHIYVIGWYCGAKGCSSTPRRLGENLRFDAASSRSIERVKRLPMAWNFTLNCAVAGNRLTRCHAEKDSRGSGRAEYAATRLVHSIRIQPHKAYQGREGARAIVHVAFHSGDCPPWHCTSTPAPPPPRDP
jgi:hypothetical protein